MINMFFKYLYLTNHLVIYFDKKFWGKTLPLPIRTCQNPEKSIRPKIDYIIKNVEWIDK